MPKKARHKCKFCGKNGHDLRTCALPGAVLLRELLKKKGHVSKQTGRRPPRFGGRTKGTAAKKAKVRYTGRNGRTKAQRKRLDENPTYLEKSKKVLEAQVSKACQLAQNCWEKRLSEGLFRMPKKCEKCRYGRYNKKLEWIRPKNQGKFHVSLKFSSHAHYVIRCGEQECRHRLNVVRTGPWPLDTCRSLTLQQVDEMLSLWEDAKVQPPSPREISKRVKCSKYAASQFLDFLTRKTAAVSKAQASGAQPLPVTYRPKNVYEIDGTGIGKFYVPWKKGATFLGATNSFRMNFKLQIWNQMTLNDRREVVLHIQGQLEVHLLEIKDSGMEEKTCFRHTFSEILSGSCSDLGFDMSEQWSSLDSSTSFEACSSEA